MRATLLEINKAAARYFYVQLKSENGKKAHEYLTGRKLSEDTIRAFGWDIPANTVMTFPVT